MSIEERLKALEDWQQALARVFLAPPQPVKSPATLANENRPQATSNVRMLFPEDIEAQLNFEVKGNYVIVKPKQFLGSERFAKISQTIRTKGGEYISAGKDSHWRVPT
jgi:hypothetical protein